MPACARGFHYFAFALAEADWRFSGIDFRGRSYDHLPSYHMKGDLKRWLIWNKSRIERWKGTTFIAFKVRIAPSQSLPLPVRSTLKVKWWFKRPNNERKRRVTFISLWIPATRAAQVGSIVYGASTFNDFQTICLCPLSIPNCFECTIPEVNVPALPGGTILCCGCELDQDDILRATQFLQLMVMLSRTGITLAGSWWLVISENYMHKMHI